MKRHGAKGVRNCALDKFHFLSLESLFKAMSRFSPPSHDGRYRTFRIWLRAACMGAVFTALGLNMYLSKNENADPGTRNPGPTVYTSLLRSCCRCRRQRKMTRLRPWRAVAPLQDSISSGSRHRGGRAACRSRRRPWGRGPGRGAAGCRGRWAWSGPGCCGSDRRG